MLISFRIKLYKFFENLFNLNKEKYMNDLLNQIKIQNFFKKIQMIFKLKFILIKRKKIIKLNLSVV